MASTGLVILDSARKRGYDDADLLHVVAFALAIFDQDDGMQMHVGPTRSGAMLEVGVIVLHDGRPGIAHAMPARPKFLRRMGMGR